MAQTIEAAKQARLADTNIITIGIKGWLNEEELREVASDPDDANSRVLPNYDALPTIINTVHDLLCDGGGCMMCYWYIIYFVMKVGGFIIDI